MAYDTSRQNFINQQRGDLMIHIAIVEDEAFYVQQIQNYMERYRQESRREISVTVYSDGEDILDNYSDAVHGWDDGCKEYQETG